MFDIYMENNPYISGDDWNEIVSKMIDDKELYHLKPVSHKGVKMPVTLIVDDFAKYYHCNNIDENDLKIQLYNQVLYNHIEMLVVDACGALTLTIAFDKKCSLFNKNAINQNGECIIGFLILIDKRIKKYMPTDGIIYHEYYHCMKENGLLSYNYDHILKEGKTDYSYEDVSIMSGENRIEIDTKEEIEADNFARENVPGGRLCLYRLPKIYCDMNNIHNIFVKMYINLIINGRVLSQGRKIFK